MIKFLTIASMQRRLFIQLALIAALLSVLLFLTVRAVAQKAAADTQDNILAASALAIGDALYTDGGEVRLELPYSALSMLGTISEDRVFYRVDVDDETLTGYEDLSPTPLQDDDAATQFSTFTYKGEVVRAITLTRRIGTGSQSRNVRVVVAQTRLGLALISSRITATAVPIGLAFFVLATGLSLWAAKTALRPISRLADAVTRRGARDLRPVSINTPAELVPLVEALNSFIARLKATLSRSEDLITEAAHRVRTPLAVVRTQAEVVHRSLEKSKNKTALREMIRAVDESSRSAGQLLDHAMVNFRTDQFLTEEIDLGQLVAETKERLLTTASLKDITINLILPDIPKPYQGDSILLQNALRNILDNAIKYSPADTEITLTLETDAKYHVISCTDEGRGFLGDDYSNHLKRFSRGENAKDVIGSGLGLTIVSDVARAHGGKIDITKPSKGVGACVSLFLPIQ